MWSAVYKKLWVVILLPLLAVGIAYYFTGRKANSYRSVAVIEASIPDQAGDVHKSAAQTLKDLPEPDEYYDNMVAAMKTEVITSMVSYRLLLHDLEKEIAFRAPAIQYSDDRKQLIKTTLEKKLSSFELLSETDPTEQTINKVIHNMDYNIGRWIRDGQMSVERKPGSNDIEVGTSTEDPFLSAFASNALSQEYIRFETVIKSPAPKHDNDSVGFYKQEVDRLRKNMEAKTEELNEASATKTTTATNDIRFQRAKANRVAEYEMRITEEEWELSTLRERLAKLERPENVEPEQATVDVNGNTKIQAIRKKIDQLNGIYVEGGSKDARLDSIINVLRKQLNDETARLQATSRRNVASNNSAVDSEREMLESRIRRHEQNIESIRNDIRRLKNTTPSANSGQNNTRLVAQLKKEQEQATADYNVALTHLKKLEAKSGVATTTGRASHHLILKEKALPSAEPESPYAMIIILSSFVGTLAVVLIWIAVTRPTPPPMDDIFLRVNYANQRRLNKKSTPVTEGGPL